jgi:hypothetical protein
VTVHRPILKCNDTNSALVDLNAPDIDPSMSDPDLCRAKELLELHHEVRTRHHQYYQAGGLNEDLSRIRQEVKAVHAELRRLRTGGVETASQLS